MCPLDSTKEMMLKLPVEEMQMSMSDAALPQPDTVPWMVATRKPFCVHFWSSKVHVSQVNSDSAPPVVCTKFVRGTAVHGVLWAGQHGGCQKRRSSYVHVFGGSGEETGSSVNESGRRGHHSCTIELPVVQNSLANSSRSPSWRTRKFSCTARS